MGSRSKTELQAQRALLMACCVGLVFFVGCGETGTSPDTLTAEVSEATEVFTRSNWERLATDPDAFKGATVEVVGKVFVPVERGDEGVVWQMFVDPESGSFNCIVHYDDMDFDLANDDYVHVTGTVLRQVEGQNLMGGTISAPLVKAHTATITDALATAPTPEHSIDVQQEQSQNDVTVAVEKVEIAPRETRVHLTVTNESDDKFHFNAFSARIVQGNRQYDPEFRMDYPEPQAELLPEVSTSGIVTFESIEHPDEFRVILEGMSDDWQTEFEPFEFDVAPTVTDEADNASDIH